MKKNNVMNHVNTNTARYKAIIKTFENNKDNAFKVPNPVNILRNLSTLSPHMRTSLLNGIDFMETNGTPYFFDTVYLADLNIPELQRDLDMNRVYSMIENWDNYIATPIVVHFDTTTGKLDIDDGQHLAVALSIMGRETWAGQYYVDLDMIKRGKIFVTQQSKRRGLSSGAKYHTEYVTGYGNGAIFKKIADDYNVTICKKGKTYRNVSSLRALEKIYKEYGEDGLYYTFDLIEETPFAELKKGYVEAILRVGFFSYEYCRHNSVNYTKLVKQLKSLSTIERLYGDIYDKCPNTNAKHPENGVQPYIEKLFNT